MYYPLQSTNFYLGWDLPLVDPYYGNIFWRGLEFGRLWYNDPAKEWGFKCDGKWTFNRGTVAIELGYHPPESEPFFDSPTRLIQVLEETFPHERAAQIYQGTLAIWGNKKRKIEELSLSS